MATLVGPICITERINWLLYSPPAPLSENMILEEQNLKLESTKPLPFPKKLLSRIIKFSIQLIELSSQFHYTHRPLSGKNTKHFPQKNPQAQLRHEASPQASVCEIEWNALPS
jgi:hypothetical protein